MLDKNRTIQYGNRGNIISVYLGFQEVDIEDNYRNISREDIEELIEALEIAKKYLDENV